MNKKMNYALVMVLGSALAVGCTSTFDNAIAAAFASIVTVVCVGLLTNVLKSFIADVKVPAVLVITAGVGTAVLMLTNALFPVAFKATNMYLVTLSSSLLAYGLTVKSNSLGDLVKDACYFGATLVVMGFVREFIAYGKVLGSSVEFMSNYTVSVFGQVPGGLICLGIVLACFNKDGYRFDVKDILEEKEGE